MFESVFQDIKREFRSGNMVTRLIIINCTVFVLLNVILLFFRIGNQWHIPEAYLTFRNFFCMSSDLWHNISHPWAIITSMFLHEGFGHLLWNMLFLYWFGSILRDLIGDHRIFPIYLLGGLLGVVVFFVSALVFPYIGNQVGMYVLGASAAIMAIVVASGIIAPDYEVNLLLIGRVKLKFIVLFILILDLISIANDANTGGHFAHLGGALMGWFFVKQLQNGNDLGAPINQMLAFFDKHLQSIRNPKMQSKRPRTQANSHKKSDQQPQQASNKTKKDHKTTSQQEKLDLILDKIKDKGYHSLTQEEKDFLFKASKKD